MAEDNDTTPEATPETPAVDPTPAAEAPDAGAAPPEEASAAETPAAPTGTRKEQRVAAQHVESSKRTARTPEERHAERTAERKRKAAQRTRRREKAKGARGEERGPQKTESPVEHGPGRPKVRQGLVISDKADKTITVRIESARRHRRYEKIVRSSSTLHAHDEANDANAGDLVRIIESRPLSRLKRWRLVEVLERAK